MNSELQINPVLRKILHGRGYEDCDIPEYLSAKPKKTYDPFLMKGMDEISDLIIKYARENRKICIYGDYDADGITSVTLLTSFLNLLSSNVTYYIPSRFEEGYGLNMSAVKKLYDDGTEMIVTVDCGCVSYEEVEYAKSLGMEIIVTDHHNLEGRAADCLMLNPKQVDDSYPFQYLCGCGVAFKLAQAINRKTDISKEELNRLLDVVGIATVADIVPLKDENRTLVKYGIDRIKKQQRPGLNGLLKEISMDPMNMQSYNIAFGIAPHLNSCGRLETADTGVELLKAQDPDVIAELSSKLASLNEKRRKIQEDTYEAAVNYIDLNMSEDKFIVYYVKNAHEGITGIVAGKLKDKYYRPVIIVTESKEAGVLKGTGRSIEGVNLYGLLNQYGYLFEKYGGHAGACGFSMKSENLEILRTGLQDDIKKMEQKNPLLLEFKLVPEISVDASEISLDLAIQVGLMEPFGAENQKPLFEVNNVNVLKIFFMGAKQQYRKLRCESDNGNTFDAVMFDSDVIAEFDAASGSTGRYCVIAELDLNIWNGRQSVQLTVKSIGPQR